MLHDNVEIDHETESDNDLEQAEGLSRGSHKRCRTTWLTKTPLIKKLRRRTSINIVIKNPVPVGCDERAKTDLDPFFLLFSDEVIEMIVPFTSKNMEHNRNAKKLADNACTKDTNCSKVKCLLAVFLFGGVYHDTKQLVKDLWYSNLASRPICRVLKSFGLKSHEWLMANIAFYNTDTIR